MRVSKPNQTTTMNYEKLRAAFLQGEEQEVANVFREMMRGAVRAGIFEAMATEVEALCGPRYRPDSGSHYQRAGSEKGVAYLGRVRPWKCAFFDALIYSSPLVFNSNADRFLNSEYSEILSKSAV
jgi:hypothetical protein